MKPITTLFLCVSLAFVSCEKTIDSKLRGKWQLCFETQPNSSVHKVDSIFYSFDNDVISLQNIERPTYTRQAFGKYSISKDSILFEYVDWDGTHEFLKKRKIIMDHFEQYHIHSITTNSLHLVSKDRELLFRKF